MKRTTFLNAFLFFFCLFTAYAASAQTTPDKKAASGTDLKTYLIEREIPDAGKLSAEQLKSISQSSCTVIKSMGPRIEWVHSYVTGNKIYCVYRADSEATIREHAKKGGFPVTSIMPVGTTISPATAE